MKKIILALSVIAALTSCTPGEPLGPINPILPQPNPTANPVSKTLNILIIGNDGISKEASGKVYFGSDSLVIVNKRFTDTLMMAVNVTVMPNDVATNNLYVDYVNHNISINPVVSISTWLE